MMVPKPCLEECGIEVPFAAEHSMGACSLYLYGILCNRRYNNTLGSHGGGNDNEEGMVESQSWTCTGR